MLKSTKTGAGEEGGGGGGDRRRRRWRRRWPEKKTVAAEVAGDGVDGEREKRGEERREEGEY